MSVDTIRSQVIWDRLLSVVEEQGQVLLRTAFSPIVRECGDLSAGVFDLKGRMLAQAVTGTPGHVNSMAEAVAHFIRHFPLAGMADGDIYITNDPWMGTGHLNDFVLTSPVFLDGRLVALMACTSHITDIGGLGTGPDGTDVHMEGIYIPMLKLADRGEMNQTLLALIRRNTRQPVETEGDVYSLAACNEVGGRRLLEMMREFGLTDLNEIGAHICGHSQAAVEAEIASLPRGTYRNTMKLEGYDKEIELVAALTVTDDTIEVDFDGSSPLSRYGINVPMSYTAAYTCFGLGCIIAPQVPNNAGSLAPLRIRAPEGSIVNATYPAAVCSRRVVGQVLPDLVFGCLYQAVPDRVPAEGASGLWNMSFRGSSDVAANERRLFAITAVSNGGMGALPTKDGLSATAYPSGVRGTPVEINESVAPLLFHRKELRPDSGGPGQFRGGLGQVIEISSAIGADFELLAAFDRITFPPRGRADGHDGAGGALFFRDGDKLRSKGTQDIPAGEHLIVHTPGGAGYGDPAKRDGAALARDIRDGLVSEAQAAAVYRG